MAGWPSCCREYEGNLVRMRASAETVLLCRLCYYCRLCRCAAAACAACAAAVWSAAVLEP